jgi:hypothetical protein
MSIRYHLYFLNTKLKPKRIFTSLDTPGFEICNLDLLLNKQTSPSPYFSKHFYQVGSGGQGFGVNQ